jgi:alanine racemase
MEIRSAALRSNLSLFRGLVGENTQLAPVVKANAYGHGLAEVVRAASEHADWFAVHTAAEAAKVREVGVDHPILVMGLVTPSDEDTLDHRTHVVVSCTEVLEWLGSLKNRRGVAVPVHLKIDTGTHRQGISDDAIPRMCHKAAAMGLEIVGAATHFANIEDTLEHQFARTQLGRFHEALAAIRAEGVEPRWTHAACSAAALLFREADFTLARIGISMYGHWPSRETRLSWVMGHPQGSLNLEPVLSWKTVVGQVQKVRRGETVGYGRTWTALRDSRLAVLPMGYSDGYPRCLGNRARVLVRGRPVPVVGRVCMNITMVDVTDVPDAGVGDEVVLIGKQGQAEITVEELAEHAGTINYELLARLAPHIPRRVV